MVLLERKLYFSKDPEGVQHFPEGAQLFLGGVQMLISIQTLISCDFPGGGGRDPSPLWIRTCCKFMSPLQRGVVHIVFGLIPSMLAFSCV